MRCSPVAMVLVAMAMGGCARAPDAAADNAASQPPGRAAPAPSAPAQATPSAAEASRAPGVGPVESATAPRAGAAGEAEAAPRFIARGAEPFWAVEASDAGLVLKTLDRPAGEPLAARRQPTLHGLRWAGAAGGRAYSLDLVEGECSDGMSDRHYAYRATWMDAGKTSQGCGERLD